MPFETSSDEIKMLAVKLAAVTDRVEMRLTQVSEQALAASQAMAVNAKQAQEIADRTLNGALAEFRRAASDTVASGMRDAVANHEQTLSASTQRLVDAINKLELQLRKASAAHLATAWKAFIAFGIASIVVMALAGYLAWQAHSTMKQVQWVQEIDAAEAAGKLARCPEGGLCVMLNKNWQRINR